MIHDLIAAATNALRELKHAHEHHYPHVLCLGRHLCPCANAIAELEAELGMAQMPDGDRCPKVWGWELWEHMSREHGLTLMESELHEIIDISVKLKSGEDPEFQAVDTTTTKKDTEQPAQREFPHCPLCGADPFYQLLSRREKVAAYAGIPDPSTAIAKAREALEAVVKTDKQSLAELRVKIPSYKPSQEMLALMEQCREALALLATPKEKA